MAKDQLRESTATVQTLPPAQSVLPSVQSQIAAARQQAKPEPPAAATQDMDFLRKVAVGIKLVKVTDEDGEHDQPVIVSGKDVDTAGKTLWLVSLPSHKSRVMGPKGAPMMVDQLPIWAEHQGEAQRIFQDIYHTGLQSIHRIVVEPAPV